MRKLLLVLAVGTGIACLCLAWQGTSTHQLNIRTYLHSVPGLKPGSPVWVDGVELGSVTSVRVLPELGERPVEVLMKIRTPYVLSLPNDSTSSISSKGVLGPALVEIDTRKAKGPPIGNDGILTSIEVTDNQAANAMEKLGNILIEESKKLRDKDKPPAAAARPGK